MQEILLKEIRRKTGKGSSLNDVLATVLNISYDAAHRRVSGKSKLTLDETVALCRHFNLSLDQLFSHKEAIVCHKTKEVNSLSDLIGYFKDSAEHVSAFLDKETNLYYSAKDIPLFYTIGGSLLSKFKLFVWLQLLNPEEKLLPFERFVPDTGLLDYSSRLLHVYKQANVIEIWNDTTINSTVQQIHYFFESGLVSTKSALLLLDDVIQIIEEVEQKCSQNEDHFKLYYNELLILSNNVLLCSEDVSKLFVPHTMIGYFITEDFKTVQSATHYFLNQVQHSKSLNQSGIKDRMLFFSKAKQKVELYRTRITNPSLFQ